MPQKIKIRKNARKKTINIKTSAIEARFLKPRNMTHVELVAVELEAACKKFEKICRKNEKKFKQPEPPLTPVGAAQNYYKGMSRSARLTFPGGPIYLIEETSKISGKVLRLKPHVEPVPTVLRNPLTKMEVRRQATAEPQPVPMLTSRAVAYKAERLVMAKSDSAVPGLPDTLGGTLTTADTSGDAFGANNGQIENIAFHDFATYDYLFDPWVPEQTDELRTSELDTFNTYWALVPNNTTIQKLVVMYLYTQIARYARTYLMKWMGDTSAMQAWVNLLLANFLFYGIKVIYPLYIQLNAKQRDALFMGLIRLDLARWASVQATISIFHPFSWQRVAGGANWLLTHPEGLLHGYSFVPFPEKTVNFGIRTTYRQEWRPLGNQFGDIVRTIPLGPRQSEKIAIKILRRNKATRQLESATSTETTTEASETVKDSSELVEEAASSFKWHTEAEASGSFDMFGAQANVSVSGGMEGSSSESSKETKSRLSESMQKTAHKMRRDTKVTVSTETETSFQEERSSEITNPNDEVAITYVFQRLQRQYEIHTFMAEVASVIFVAEEVPDSDMLEEWIKKYGWIISKVLLDESFREALNLIVNEAAPVTTDEYQEEIGKLNGLIEATKTGLAGVKDMPGASITNVFDASQNNYISAFKEKRAYELSKSSQTLKRDRLIEHVKDNILHYCRAVWNKEDPEQRLMRYANIYVPMQIDFVINPGVNFTVGTVSVPGRFAANPDSTKFVPLSELVNPAGPIGYAGNYAVFYMKDEPTLTTHNMALQFLKLPYYQPFTIEIVGDNQNTGQAQVTGRITNNNLSGLFRRYTLTIKAGSASNKRKLSFSILGIDGNQAPQSEPEVTFSGSGPWTFNILGIELMFTGMPQINDKFEIVVLSRLRDPELLTITKDNPLPAEGSQNETDLFDKHLLTDMLRMMPGLREELLRLTTDSNVFLDDWSGLNDAQKKRLRLNYHDFLLRREHTRQFLVDTNSLVLNLVTGTGSTLEPFKRAHRFLDVVKAATEVERRKGLLAKENYGDPDIEKVVVLESNGQTSGALIAGAEAAHTDGHGSSTP